MKSINTILLYVLLATQLKAQTPEMSGDSNTEPTGASFFKQSVNPETLRKYDNLTAEMRAKDSLMQNGSYMYEWVNQHNKFKRESNMLKSTQAIKPCLERIVQSDWDENASQWQAKIIEEYSYDTNGNITGYRYSIRNDITNQMDVTDKKEYFYDSRARLDHVLYYTPDDNGSQLLPKYKEEFFYDGNSVRFRGYDSPLGNGSWTFIRRGEYTYDSRGNLLDWISSDWDKDKEEWIYWFKIECLYDYPDGNIKSYKRYAMNQESKEWFEQIRFNYYYDSPGNLLYYIHYFRYYDSEQLKKTAKEGYTYDNDGNLIQRIGYSREVNKDPLISDSTWNENSKKEYTYDNFGNRISETVYFMEFSTNEYYPSSKKNILFDLSYSYSDLILPPIPAISVTVNAYWYYWAIETPYKPLGFIEYTYDNIDKEWNPHGYKTEYFYSNQNITNVIEIEKVFVEVYPNPANDEILLKTDSQENIDQVQVFDLSGAMIKSFANTKALDITDVPSGLYILQIKTNLQVIRKSVIIK